MLHERRAGVSQRGVCALKIGFVKGTAMDMITYAGHAAGAIEPPHALRDEITQLVHRVLRARRARRDLASLRCASEHLLNDIGLTRGQVDSALNVPFWVDPSVRLAASRKRQGR
jgi:uncharacterized protein YjiS (DUF1127 family)